MMRLLRKYPAFTAAALLAMIITVRAATTVNGPSIQANPQPAFSDLSGSAACSQQPALTGDTTTSAGACATTTGKVNGVSYGTSPSTNTVPVVTGTNTVTYEAVPNAALANAATTVNGVTCTLGSTCTVAAVGAGITTSAKTTNYTVLSGDNGTYFDNTGAAGEVDFTLPTEADGMRYCFTVVAVQTVKVIAPTGVKIAMGTTNSATAGNLTAATAYSHVCMFAPKGATTQWVVDNAVGTWTVN